MDVREPVLPALLGRLKGDGLPFRLLLCRAAGVKMHHGARGKEGKDLGRADFDRFLHDEIHVFPLRYGLGKGNAGLQRRGDGLLQNVQPDRGGIERGDLGGGFASLPIEEDDAIARLKPEHAAGVVRLGAGQGGG